jgi:hypothetical protein
MTHDQTPAEMLDAVNTALDEIGAPTADGLGVPGGDLDLVGRIRAWADDREGDEWRARQAGSAAVRAALLDRMRASRDLRLGAAASIAPGSAALRRYATMEESAVYLVSDLLPVSDEDGGA